MAYFGADLQNANNIGKTTEILATWELVNELENHFINARKKIVIFQFFKRVE